MVTDKDFERIKKRSRVSDEAFKKVIKALNRADLEDRRNQPIGKRVKGFLKEQWWFIKEDKGMYISILIFIVIFISFILTLVIAPVVIKALLFLSFNLALVAIGSSDWSRQKKEVKIALVIIGIIIYVFLFWVFSDYYAS